MKVLIKYLTIAHNRPSKETIVKALEVINKFQTISAKYMDRLHRMEDLHCLAGQNAIGYIQECIDRLMVIKAKAEKNVARLS